jgi:ABC-type sugar transport system permease subunit
MALPLLIPFNVVGTIWQIFGRVDIGLLGWTRSTALGIDYNYTNDPLDAWITVIVMDVWHWTSLVALLCYAGLQSIPDAYYQAARIDQASALGGVPLHRAAEDEGRAADRRAAALHGQLHDLHRALRRHRRRPRQSTTFLSIDLVKMAFGQFDLGPAAAFSIVYFLIILLVSWVFYTVMTNLDKEDQYDAPARSQAVVMTLYLLFLMVPIYWLIEHEPEDQHRDHLGFTLFPQDPTFANYMVILTDPSWYMGYVNSLIYVVMNTVISITVALPAAYAFSRYGSWATSTCSSGC